MLLLHVYIISHVISASCSLGQSKLWKYMVSKSLKWLTMVNPWVYINVSKNEKPQVGCKSLGLGQDHPWNPMVSSIEASKVAQMMMRGWTYDDAILQYDVVWYDMI